MESPKLPSVVQCIGRFRSPVLVRVNRTREGLTVCSHGRCSSPPKFTKKVLVKYQGNCQYPCQGRLIIYWSNHIRGLMSNNHCIVLSFHISLFVHFLFYYTKDHSVSFSVPCLLSSLFLSQLSLSQKHIHQAVIIRFLRKNSLIVEPYANLQLL